MIVCSGCNGTGHDKGGKPVLEVKIIVDDEGTKRRKLFTKSIGSGCIVCQGQVTGTPKA